MTPTNRLPFTLIGIYQQIKQFPDNVYICKLIINALYLPDCDTSVLTQDMDPINTFPIVFNCYFDANIPLK